jgi:hypothetical protein
VEHSILTAVWHMLINNIDYQDLGPDHFTRRNPDRVYGESPNKPTLSALPSASSPAPETAKAT